MKIVHIDCHFGLHAKNETVILKRIIITIMLVRTKNKLYSSICFKIQILNRRNTVSADHKHTTVIVDACFTSVGKNSTRLYGEKNVMVELYAYKDHKRMINRNFTVTFIRSTAGHGPIVPYSQCSCSVRFIGRFKSDISHIL